MFSRLHHVLNAETFTIFVFIVSLGVFSLIVVRAILMKKDRVKKMSELPFEEPPQPEIKNE